MERDTGEPDAGKLARPVRRGVSGKGLPHGSTSLVAYPTAAYIYMSATGSPHQMEKGKSAMVNAVAGLAIVLSARVIAGMIQSALGTGG